LPDSKGYYALLGVSQSASYHEIRRAYRKLARRYHPDKNSSSLAEEMIKRVNAAFEVLSDISKRKEYDSIGVVSSGMMETLETGIPTPSSQYDDLSVENAGWSRQHAPAGTGRYSAQPAAEELIGSPLLPETPKGRFHIIVEPSLCMAFGSCEILAPKVFVVEKNKRFNPKAIVECETCADFDLIYAAAQTCPTKAIKLVDRYTGEQLFP
jgi:molecular chaperone DnaJ